MILLALWMGWACAGPPDWAVNDTQSLEGTRYRAVCTGTGPSLGIARQEAVENCRVSAAQYLNVDLNAQWTTITSERESALHQEVRQKARVSGLVCIPKRERIEETDGQVKLWLSCEFDLSKARLLGVAPEEEWEPGHRVEGGLRYFTLASVPPCQDLIVQGEAPARLIRCRGNPVSFLMEPGDREIIVRARHYVPKRVLATGSYGQVLLDRAF